MSRKPVFWLEAIILLILAAASFTFFFMYDSEFFAKHLSFLTQPDMAWLRHLNFPLTGGFLALAAYFFFPNQNWRIPLIVLLCVGMAITGFPPREKLNFGLDLAGGTELMVKIEKTAQEARKERLERRVLDIQLAETAKDNPDSAEKRDKLLAQLNSQRDDIQRQIAELAGEQGVDQKRNQLRLEIDRIQQRIADLSGRNNDELSQLKDEIREISSSRGKTDIGEVLQILRERILATSLTEIKVARAGENRILIQIPGLDEGRVDIIKSVIERQGILEFRLVKEMTDSDREKARKGEQIPGYELMTDDSGQPVYVSKDVPVGGSDLANASSSMSVQEGWEVIFTMSAAGRRKACRTDT
ncbi:MAG: hypothetical protein U5N86_06705 [Planctomycetota bacterium]|nr:hypothetical protein [Planctomycetota bacterium]